MKKQWLALIMAAVLMMTSTVSVFAVDETQLAETFVESSSEIYEETDITEETVLELETEVLSETQAAVLETESVLDTEIVSERETVLETEEETLIEMEAQTLTEKLMETSLSMGGTLELEQDLYASGYNGSLDSLDKNSDIVPFCLTYTYYFAEAQKIHELVNQVRIDAGVAPLQYDSYLEEDACVRASEIAIVFDHTRPNGQPWHSLDSYMDGENIAGGYRTAEQIVAAWVQSRDHYANMIDPDFKSMGVGMVFAEDTDYGYYCALEMSCSEGDGYCIDAVTETTSMIVEAAVNDATCEIRNFVLRLYEVVFGRQADYDGLVDWFNQLFFGKNTGAGVAFGFFFSDEFKNQDTSDEEYVDILYATMFDRAGDPAGKQGWLDDLKAGFSREYVFRGFVESQEFTDLCDEFGIIRGSVSLSENRDQNTGITRFVSRLYSKALGRSPEAAGLNDWTGRILRGEATPETVAFGFFFSDEMKLKKLDDVEFVKVLYRVFLDREADPAGLADWVSRLEAGMKREAVMYGVSKSAEFGKILEEYGLSQTQGELVYVTNTGAKYHKSSCRMTNQSKVPILIEDAKYIGYTACQICH